jgi:hypothetical protein
MSELAWIIVSGWVVTWVVWNATTISRMWCNAWVDIRWRQMDQEDHWLAIREAELEEGCDEYIGGPDDEATRN